MNRAIVASVAWAIWNVVSPTFIVSAAENSVPSIFRARNTTVDEKTGIELIFVPGGSFTMGSENKDCNNRIRTKTVQPFLLGATEVTVEQFRSFTRATGYKTEAEIKGRLSELWDLPGKDDLPVVNVNWDDAVAFCEWAGMRLPSEAEWEYAAGDGNQHKNWAGTSEESELGDYAWHSGNSGDALHPVRQKRRNEFGLFDMSGNAWEWCNDPHPPGGGDYVVKGGCFKAMPVFVTVACRNGGYGKSRANFIGFRVARDVQP